MLKFLVKFAQKYPIHHVPWYWQPLYFPYCVFLGALTYIFFKFLRYFCRIQYEGLEHFTTSRSQIYAFWHSYSFPFFAFFPRFQKQIWLFHPHWYMGPILYATRWLGIKNFAFGSTGYDGKEAAKAVIQGMKTGLSSGICPDGPYGPPKTVYKGVFHMAQQSGAEVLPIAFEIKHSFSLPTWDRKIIPLPFSLVKMRFGKPILAQENFEPQKELLKKELNYFENQD